MGGGHDAHGHDAHGAHGHGGHGHGGDDVPAHGSAEIPPPPLERSISPARDEYAQPWPGALLLWPLVWVAAAFLFYAAARRWTGPIDRDHGHAPHARAEPPAR
jgi:hypothetical protein